MALAPGTRVGVYQVTATIGQGGMGQVFRAHDTRLHRDVALKVLPDSFAGDRERLARFAREAQVLASLNHPHIAAIYGLEESGDTQALVMELVTGVDLSAHVARGPLSWTEAVAIARQIADALDAAHEQGIVHRDLKPANIKVREDGAVKVLDFGLARIVDPAEDLAASADIANSPTITSPATAMGIVLGTAAYMSPEQARGRAVDRRADVWAFGVVLFEMLTGRPLFAGETVSDTLAAVLTRTIEWTAVPPGTPPALTRLLQRCLERDPKKRLRDIGDAKWELDALGTTETLSRVPAPRTARMSLLPWMVAALALGTAGWVAWTARTGLTGTTTDAVTYTDVTFPRDMSPQATVNGGFGISPDGRQVFVLGFKRGQRRFFLRDLDTLVVTEIADSSGSLNGGTFSPDGASLALNVGGGVIATLSLADRQRTVVAPEADISGSVEWGEAGIVFVRNSTLFLATTNGDDARRLTTLDSARHELLHEMPVTLPGGRTVLFSSLTSDPNTNRIEAVSIENGARSVVLERATTPVWAPTGHLLFARDGAVFAVAFDPEAVAVRGPALPVLPPGVVDSSNAGGLSIRLSRSGALLFAPVGFNSKTVVSVGRDGSAIDLRLAMARYQNPRVSPDGRRLLIENGSSQAADVIDLGRMAVTRLTPPSAYGVNYGTWTADGERVVLRLFNTPAWVATDGSGKTGPVPTGSSNANNYPSAPGPDADSVLMVRTVSGQSGDIFLVSVTGAFEPRPIVTSPGYDGGPSLSPDKRWLLFSSSVSGQFEAYVTPYPTAGRQWPVSSGGGVHPRWSRDGREIYYRADGGFVAVPFTGSGPEPVIGKPVMLFADTYDFGVGISIPNYDVTPDGRFVVTRRDAGDGGLKLGVNWTSELERILAAGGVK